MTDEPAEMPPEMPPAAESPEAATPPDMTDLYRRLLNDLTERFGGSLDDANADAIAYAAAELYHRDFEPRLWQEKSAHDLLDLFGIPRAGVFAPYALSDRLMLFQQRSSQPQYVSRAHELLDTLGVPRKDGEGKEQTLKWRLDQVQGPSGALSGVLGPPGEEAEGQPSAAAELAEAAVGAVDGQGSEDLKEDVKAAVAETVEEVAGTPEATERSPESEVVDHGLVDNTRPDEEPPDRESDTSEPADVAADSTSDGDKAKDGEPGDKNRDADSAPAEVRESGEASGSQSNGEKGGPPEAPPAQLMDAVRALEQAVEAEAELAKSPGGGGGVDLVGLTDTLNGIQGEIAAVRELVEAFEIGMRRQLDALQAQITAIGQANGQGRGPFTWQSMEGGDPSSPAAPGPTVVAPRPSDPTRLMSPLAEPDADEVDGDLIQQGKEASLGRRSLRRVLLLVLLVVLGLLLAGGVVLAVTVGWESIRSEVSGLLAPGL